MSERLVTIIFIALLCGQIIALFKGRQVAVKYYFFAAPLGYFGIWFFLTWDPARACGLLLIAGGFFLWATVEGRPRFSRHILSLFLVYIVVITFIGSFFWPIEAMAGVTEVYSYLRGPVQILTWLIMLGSAWQIAIALSQKGAFDNIRKFIITIGVLHSLYAIYQVVAYYTGLPLTGLRRAAMGVTMDLDGEQLAMTSYANIDIFRATSLVGEPKSFGAISLIWITLILTLYLEKKSDSKLAWTLILSLVALGLTYSSSAWVGLLIAFVIYLRFSGFRFVKMLSACLILVAGFAVIFSLDLLPLSGTDVLNIISERSTQRWGGSTSEVLQDLPEVEAIEVLKKHPEMAIFGTGLGGMSFYIAQNLGGGQSIILFPNTGVLAFLCDIGIVGIGLLFVCLIKGIRPTIDVSRSYAPQVRSLSFVGATLFAQCFVFSGGLLPFAIAFLLASEFLNKQLHREHVISLCGK